MLKIGIIGAGRIGKVHLESITYHVKGAEVVAIADPFMNDETKAFCEGFGVEKIYTDYTKIIEDKDIDAVLVCSSTVFASGFSQKTCLPALIASIEIGA